MKPNGRNGKFRDVTSKLPVIPIESANQRLLMWAVIWQSAFWQHMMHAGFNKNHAPYTAQNNLTMFVTGGRLEAIRGSGHTTTVVNSLQAAKKNLTHQKVGLASVYWKNFTSQLKRIQSNDIIVLRQIGYSGLHFKCHHRWWCMWTFAKFTLAKSRVNCLSRYRINLKWGICRPSPSIPITWKFCPCAHLNAFAFINSLKKAR